MIYTEMLPMIYTEMLPILFVDGSDEAWFSWTSCRSAAKGHHISSRAPMAPRGRLWDFEILNRGS